MFEERLSMTTREAIKYVAELHNIPSMYALAKSLSDENLNVQPIQISRYLDGACMSDKVAARFEAVYDVHISDAIRIGTFRSLNHSKPKDV